MTMPVDENVCDIKMTALTEKITLMLKPIEDGINDIKGRIQSIQDGAREYVLRSEFNDKCKEIEELKKFSWKAAGVMAIIPTIIAIISLLEKLAK